MSTLTCASVLSPERTFDLSGTSNFDPLSTERWSASHCDVRYRQTPLSIRHSSQENGAFMEPSGRNQWQPLANGKAPKTARTSQTVATGCDRLPFGAHRKRPPLPRRGGVAILAPQEAPSPANPKAH